MTEKSHYFETFPLSFQKSVLIIICATAGFSPHYIELLNRKDMAGFEESYRNILISKLNDLEKEAERFVMSPGQDFSRRRKLPFAETMKTVLYMEGNSLNKELCDLYNLQSDSDRFITKSAFVQQRGKIRHEAFKEAFRRFNVDTGMNDLNLYQGHRLLAVDGSDVNIALNPDSDTYFPPNNRSDTGYNQMHLNALYDILNNTFLDCIVQSAPKEHEVEAARMMVKRLPKSSCHTIVIADRGYASLDLMETIRDQNAEFLFRVPNGFISELALMPMTEFDTDISFTIVTEQTNEAKRLIAEGKAKSMIGPSKFGKRKKNVTWYHSSQYLMKLRAVRFQLDTGEYETLVTSLDRNRFPVDRMKEVYHLRWGIETSFRWLKYAIGMTNFHSRKEESIKQEIFARLLMYNFCARIANSVIIEQPGANIHVYKANFSQAIHICFSFLKNSLDIDIRELIRRYVEPVRPGRSDKRKLRPKGVICFNYRVA